MRRASYSQGIFQVIEYNRKVMGYKSNTMGKNGSEIEVHKGSYLADSFVTGEHPLGRSSFFTVVFPLKMAFRRSGSARDAKVSFNLNLEGFVRLAWFKALRGMRARKTVVSMGTFEHNGVLFSIRDGIIPDTRMILKINN